MSIDWSKQPYDFTLWLEGLGEHAKHSGWYRRAGEVFEHESHGQFLAFREGQFFIVHEKPDLTVWTGEGLPPVGTICELWYSNDDWGPCMVMAHDVSMGIPIAVVRHGEQCYTGSSRKTLRPIHTPEQIAEQERAKGIDEILDAYTYTVESLTHKLTLSQAARLYDANIRKVAQ